MKVTNEVKLGIVVVGAAIVFFVGIILLRGIDLRTKEYSLTIYYNNVNGLQQGSSIMVAGLRIGQVESMTLAGAGVAVNVSIQRKVQLPKDSHAKIKSESIMGGKFIEITPGIQSAILQNGDSITGTYEADLTELTATLAPISSNVLGILENVNSTFDDETRRKIKDIVTDVNRSTGELDRLVIAEGHRLDNAMGRIETFAMSLTRLAVALDTLAASNRSEIDSTVASLHRTTRNIEVLSRNLKSTSSSLDVVLEKMKNGEGTLGKLVHDESLYNHLDSLSLNMNALAKDLRENPGRYVKLTLF